MHLVRQHIYIIRQILKRIVVISVKCSARFLNQIRSPPRIHGFSFFSFSFLLLVSFPPRTGESSPAFPSPLLPASCCAFFSFTFAWRSGRSVIISLTPLIRASLRIDCFSQFGSFLIVPHATERSFQTQRGAAARRRRSLNKVIDFGNNPLTTVTPQKTG